MRRKLTDPVGLPDGFKLLLIVWKLIWTEVEQFHHSPGRVDDWRSEGPREDLIAGVGIQPGRRKAHGVLTQDDPAV